MRGIFYSISCAFSLQPLYFWRFYGRFRRIFIPLGSLVASRGMRAPPVPISIFNGSSAFSYCAGGFRCVMPIGMRPWLNLIVFD